MLLIGACAGLFVQLSFVKPPAPLAAVIPTQKALNASLSRGLAIFNKDCAACHSRHRRSCPDLLATSLERLGYSYVAQFITKQDSLRTAGDPYAIELQKMFKMASQHNFNYSPKQINDLIAFLK